MTREELNAKFNRKDISGTGVEVTYPDGCVVYYFYENFETDSDGIERAMNQLYPLLFSGKCSKLVFINNCSK